MNVAVWTHVVGVYDATAKWARLYVIGRLAATGAVPGMFTVGGSFVIGRDKWAGGLDGGRRRGDVDDVRAYQSALSDPAIATLANS